MVYMNPKKKIWFKLWIRKKSDLNIVLRFSSVPKYFMLQKSFSHSFMFKNTRYYFRINLSTLSVSKETQSHFLFQENPAAISKKKKIRSEKKIGFRFESEVFFRSIYVIKKNSVFLLFSFINYLIIICTKQKFSPCSPCPQ